MPAIKNGKAGDVGTLTNTGGTPDIASILGDTANSSIATRLGVIQNHLGPSYNNSRYLAVTATLTSATWNSDATHEVFTVTGTVRMRMWITCSSNVGSVGGTAVLMFGTETDTDAFIASTDETEIDSGDLWYDATPTTQWDTFGNVVMDYVITGGLDVGYEIDTEACNAGVLTFHCVWEPLSSDGAVTAGAGGALA